MAISVPHRGFKCLWSGSRAVFRGWKARYRMATSTDVFEKFPSEIVDYGMDWSALPEIVAGATITAASVSAPSASGLSFGSVTISGNITSSLTSAGNAGWNGNAYWQVTLSTTEIRICNGGLSLTPET